MFIRSAWDWGFGKINMWYMYLSPFCADDRIQAWYEEKWKIQARALLYILLCIVVVHHLCTHYNTQVHFLTASQYQSWQKSFLLFSEVRSDRNLGCRLNLRDSGLPEIFGWIIVFCLHPTVRSWRSWWWGIIHVVGVMAELVTCYSWWKLMMVWLSVGDTHKSYDRHSFWQNGLPSKRLL